MEMTIESDFEQTRQDSAASVQPNAASPCAEYKIGPGFPPKEYQFRKGQSGNPKGAKRKAPSLVLDFRRLLEEALERKVTLSQGQKKRTLNMFALGIEQLVKQFAQGDRHARKQLFEFGERVGLDLLRLEQKVIQNTFEAPQQFTPRDGELTDDEMSELTKDELFLIEQAENITNAILDRRLKH